MSGDFSDVLSRRLEDPPPGNGRGSGERWEDRHVRWTVWIDRDLRAQIEALRKARDMSTRELLDELLRLGLEQTTAPHSPPGRRRGKLSP